MGMGLWKGGDVAVIDGALVNGSARAVGGLAGWVRQWQTGRLYTYALVMLLGIFVLLTWHALALLQRHAALRRKRRRKEHTNSENMRWVC
jgi:hypothetical protein